MDLVIKEATEIKFWPINFNSNRGFNLSLSWCPVTNMSWYLVTNIPSNTEIHQLGNKIQLHYDSPTGLSLLCTHQLCDGLNLNVTLYPDDRDKNAPFKHKQFLTK